MDELGPTTKPGLDEAPATMESGSTPPPGSDELDIDGSLLDTIEQELADVERALALIDDGTYGQCEALRRRSIDDAVLGQDAHGPLLRRAPAPHPALTRRGRAAGGGGDLSPSLSPRKGCRSP